MEKKNFIKQMLCFTLLLGIGTHIHAQSDSGFIPTDFQGTTFLLKIWDSPHHRQLNLCNMATQM
ncbi:hypothetical protein SFC43_00185 [Bacteroides sp. CR5/BHMF/2]|nr:hypothetical protein [Bacteroides sp. CR5/BHMF/2]